MKLEKADKSTFEAEIDGGVFVCRMPDEKDQMLLLAGPVEERFKHVFGLIKEIRGVQDPDGNDIDRAKFFEMWRKGIIKPKSLFEIMGGILNKFSELNQEAEEKN